MNMIPPLTVLGTFAISVSAAAPRRHVRRSRLAVRSLDKNKLAPLAFVEVAHVDRDIAPFTLPQAEDVEYRIDPDRLRLLVTRRL
jgi:hypothetical protein